MENASKALLMAGGILLGVLIIALIVTLFINSKQVSSRYESNKQELAVQQFNNNFTKYLGRNDLTIYEVVTIKNFAVQNNVTVVPGEFKNLTINNGKETALYKLKISRYDSKGYIKEISFEKII